MKAKIIYIAAFAAAFLMVTGGIIYLNSMYRNIFQFDFKPENTKSNKTLPADSTGVQMAELKNFFQNEFKQEIFDSLKTLVSSSKPDTVYANVVKDSSLIDSLRQLQTQLKKTDQALKKQDKTQKKQDQKKSTAENDVIPKRDSTYNAWIKQTSKLYESMDPDKAAKIIQSYSDNVARDIIYSMRQKQAAEILSQLDPETANRITRAK